MSLIEDIRDVISEFKAAPGMFFLTNEAAVSAIWALFMLTDRCNTTTSFYQFTTQPPYGRRNGVHTSFSLWFDEEWIKQLCDAALETMKDN